MNSWANVLASPTYIINMDACVDRYRITEERVRAAGYTDVRRFVAVDHRDCDLKTEWAKFGSPPFNPNDKEFVTYPGKQCCELSWLGVLKTLIDEKIEWATIFEDDVLFHKDWDKLAPLFWKNTPPVFDFCYLGAQIDWPGGTADISPAPAFCTHALVFNLAGAKALYSYILSQKVYTIDCMIKDAVQMGKAPFKHWVWNASRFEDPKRIMPGGWTKRNAGLVFQDVTMGTFVREW